MEYRLVVRNDLDAFAGELLIAGVGSCVLMFGFSESMLEAVKTRPPAACPVFASDLQARLLALLLHTPDQWWTTPELRERLCASPASLHDELVRLTDAGLVDRADAERPHRHRANLESPLATPLRALTEQTVAVPLRIRDAIGDEPGIEAAAIFGSWVRGDPRADSDIDLMVIGDVDFRRLVRRIRPIERDIRREINVVSYNREELANRAGSGFLRNVRREPVANLIGDVRELLPA
jgi:predicted nucleotidyltransferase